MERSDREMKEWKQSTWRISLNLDMPDLIPPAVQWAVFDEDPLPRFKAELQRWGNLHRRRISEITDINKREMARSAQIGVSWDLLFKSVTGDQVYLLTSAPGTAHMISSNEPKVQIWIATKVVQVNRKPFCWSLPVETKIGTEIAVTLTKENALNVAVVYDEVMSEESEAE